MSLEPWMLRTVLVLVVLNGFNAILFRIAHTRQRRPAD
jgi:hypothetical protein